MTTLRLLTYNVRSLRDDAAAVARVVRSAEPDVVCIQEAPRFLRWRSKCAALARHCGLVVVTGGRDCGANLILSTLAVDVSSTRDVKFTKDPRLHQRGTAIAVLRLDGASFAVAGTHLDLAAEPRRRHVDELHQAISEAVTDGVPAVVAGDINETDDGAAWRVLAAVRTDAFATAGTGDGRTMSATDPRRRIDGIFAGAPFEVRSARVLDGPDVEIASDHRPVLAELNLPG